MFTKGKTILRELGDGLVLRRSTPEDAETLSAFNRMIHTDNDPDGQCIAAWTRDLLDSAAPNVSPRRFHDCGRNRDGTNYFLHEFDLTNLVL